MTRINQATSPSSPDTTQFFHDVAPKQETDRSGPAERVRQALRARGYSTLKTLRIVVNREYVILRGPVRSYYRKQVAQETALAVEGVVAVRNEVEVVPRARPPMSRESGNQSEP